MTTLKIQRISNGQFCTAAQWAQDAIECKKLGTIDAYHFEMPSISTDIRAAQGQLNAMIALYPETSAALKIGLLCGVVKNIYSTSCAPRVVINDDITAYVVTTDGSPEEMFDASDKALRAHIETQREIVRKHSLVEI